jgi:hypothetical protein
MGDEDNQVASAEEQREQAGGEASTSAEKQPHLSLEERERIVEQGLGAGRTDEIVAETGGDASESPGETDQPI